MNKKDVTYVPLGEVNQAELLELMNDERLRVHLVEHPKFTQETLKIWVMDKTRIDATAGCCVRAIHADGNIAGWCGIQPDDDGFELAIVISNSHWGLGLKVFRNMLGWASELGHKEVLFHLLETRRKYRSLEKKAKKIKASERMGRRFLTYIISVDTHE